MNDPLLSEAIARWIQLAALGLIVGAAVAPWFERGIAVSASRHLTRQAGTVALFALLVRLLAASRGFVSPGSLLSVTDVLATLDSAWGRGWIVQACSVLAALLVTFEVATPRISVRERLVAFAACVAAPLTGHAMSYPAGVSVGAAVTSLHVLGACTWLGSLAALLLLRSTGLATALRRLMPIAFLGVGALALSGMATSWGTLGGLPLPARLLASGYGRTLALKLTLVAGALVTGLWQLRAMRIARSEHAAGSAMRRRAWLEVSLGVLVLAITAVLSLLAPPGHG